MTTAMSFVSGSSLRVFRTSLPGISVSTWSRSTRDTKPIGIDLFYKVNTAASQAKGIYTNTITFIAIPGY